MPEISALSVNETLHQGLVFIYVPPALPSPSLYKSKQLAGLLTKPNRYRARRHHCAHGCSQTPEANSPSPGSLLGSLSASLLQGQDMLLAPASHSLQRQKQQQQQQQDLDLLKVSKAALPDFRALRIWVQPNQAFFYEPGASVEMHSTEP